MRHQSCDIANEQQLEMGKVKPINISAAFLFAFVFMFLVMFFFIMHTQAEDATEETTAS